jgi:hypothetical protein
MRMLMERLAYPLNHLYIKMGPNVWANEPYMRFKNENASAYEWSQIPLECASA